LTLSGNSIHIKAPSTSSSLDRTADYVLITAGSIVGSFASTPVWDVKPANWANYTVVTSGSQVTLHYSILTPPTGSGVAIPFTAMHNQNVLISVTVTNGSGSITSVTVDASPIGGSTVSLVLSGTSHVYTNTITIPVSAAAGNYTLSAVITDSYSDVGTANISLAVNTTEVWNGGGSDQNWSTNPNWVSGFAPDSSGNSLVFAGTVGTAPNMDNSYSVTGLTFSNNAASFTIGSTTSGTLTLAGGIINNSANAQTLNVPIADAGGGLTKSGNGAVILTATNTYTGNTIINAGALNIGGAGQLNFGTYDAAIVDNGTFAYSSSATQTLSGVISGTGTLTQSAGSLTLANTETYTGGTTVNGGTLTLATGGQIGCIKGQLTINSGATVSATADDALGWDDSLANDVTNININGGTFDNASAVHNGWNTSVTMTGGTLSSSSGKFLIQGGTDSITVNSNGTPSTISATVQINHGSTLGFNVASGASLLVPGILFEETGHWWDSPVSIAKNGSGTMTLSATNNYTANTIINAGTLTIGGAGLLGNGNYAGAITNNGTFDYASSNLQTLSGVISGSGAVVVDGAGTLTLTGANTYTGNTTVNGGTLELAQATLATNSTVSISNGAVLKLDFAVTNKVTALVLNGVTQPGGVYNATTAAPYITGTGSLMVPSTGPGTFTSTPGITGFTLNGANVTMTVTDAQAGDAYYLLSSTNLSLPLNQWHTVATNVPGASGTFTFTGTNAVTSGEPQQFYILSNTNYNH
jgi:autotransporter-associated beta strand protein